MLSTLRVGGAIAWLWMTKGSCLLLAGGSTANLGWGTENPGLFQYLYACHTRNRYDAPLYCPIDDFVIKKFCDHFWLLGSSRGRRLEAHGCGHCHRIVHLWMEQVRPAWSRCPRRCFLSHQGGRTVWQWHQSRVHCMWVEAFACGDGTGICLRLGQSNKWATWISVGQRCVRFLSM